VTIAHPLPESNSMVPAGAWAHDPAGEAATAAASAKQWSLEKSDSFEPCKNANRR
jgi:hypothetical protein